VPTGTNVSMRLMSRVATRRRGRRPSRYKCRGFVGGPAASPAAGTNVTWNEIGGAPAPVPSGTNVSMRFMSRVATRAPRPVPLQYRHGGFNGGAPAPVPSGTNVSIRLMSRVATWAPRPVPLQYRYVEFRWRGTGPGAHRYKCFNSFDVAGCDTGTEAGALGYKCFNSFDVAGCDTGTEAGAPPISSRGIQWRGTGPGAHRVQM
jgi:hypothetical protein